MVLRRHRFLIRRQRQRRSSWHPAFHTGTGKSNKLLAEATHARHPWAHGCQRPTPGSSAASRMLTDTLREECQRIEQEQQHVYSMDPSVIAATRRRWFAGSLAPAAEIKVGLLHHYQPPPQQPGVRSMMQPTRRSLDRNAFDSVNVPRITWC